MIDPPAPEGSECSTPNNMKNLLVIFLLLPLFLPAADLPEGFVETRIATGLDPTRMAIAPDGRIFIAEKNGRILVVRDDVLLPDPFLTLEVDNYNERGLSSIALDPDFEFNNYVYLFYTVPGANRNRVSRVTANGDFAIPGSEEILLEMDALAGTIHNGGGMVFGPDDKLFISVGDGADAGTGQAMNTLLGKILRINRDGSIPEDNPFYEQEEGIYRSIWAVGFRNSFTMDMQPGTGRLFANDVGSEFFEEVNEIVPGGNYGWAGIEGYYDGNNPPANYRDPVYAYDHGTGCAIMGASFYNPVQSQFPERYRGKYFFGDYCEGYIKVMDPHTGEIEEVFAEGINRPIGILTAPDGSMYYLARAGLGGGSELDNTSTNDGSLWKVQFTGNGSPIIAVQPDDILVSVGEDARFEVAASGDGPLSYQWEKDGVVIPGATDPVLIYPAVSLSDDGARFRCRVNNEVGQIASLEATLSVTANARPALQILRPTPEARYAAGDTLFFSGLAFDQEDGDIPVSEMYWKIDFHHDDHTHPAMEWTRGVDSGFFVIPRVGEISPNVWYRVYLTAIDSEGLRNTAYRDIFPEIVTFTVRTEPAGIPINVDGRIVEAPHEVTSVKGILRTIVPQPFYLDGDQIYTFSGWSNGWDGPLFTFEAGELEEIEAQYTGGELFIGDGDGLLGAYYQGNEATAFQRAPVLNRIDPLINFEWGGGSPDEDRLGADNFAVRWTGEVMAPMDGTYRFYTVTDDGVRLWVNGEQVIDQWVPQAPTEVAGTAIELVGGQRYPIVMEYYEAGGGAVAQLFWENEVLPKQIVPTSQLFSGQELITGQGTGLRGNYFPGEPPTAFNQRPRIDRVDPVVDFTWGGGSPDPARLDNDFFVVRWSGEVQAPADGEYIFYTTTDDGARLWLNEQLIIDQWVPQAVTEVASSPVRLAAGQRYPIRMEYFEEAGQAEARLSWSSDLIGKQVIPASQLYPAESLNFSEDYQVEIFPSPVRETLQVRVKTKSLDVVSVSIYDLMGRLRVEESGLRLQPGSHTVQLEVSNLPIGMYYVKVKGSVRIDSGAAILKY